MVESKYCFKFRSHLIENASVSIVDSIWSMLYRGIIAGFFEQCRELTDTLCIRYCF